LTPAPSITPTPEGSASSPGVPTAVLLLGLLALLGGAMVALVLVYQRLAA
jgi:hypothetical protein